MELTKYQEKKIIRELQKSFNDKEVARRMAWCREIGLVDDYKHLEVTQALAGIIVELENAEVCESCGELELQDESIEMFDGVYWCRSCREAYL